MGRAMPFLFIRRTGKDVRGNKQIRRDEDGFEVFDDYLSPPSGKIVIRVNLAKFGQSGTLG